MPGMPDVILKSPIMHRFETFTAGVKSSARKRTKLQKAITRLSDPNDSLVDIALDLDFYSSKAAAEHFEKHWLGLDPLVPTFWPTLTPQPITTIIRLGLLKVCRLVKSSKLPAEFWWVMSGVNGTTDWEMSVSKGKRQITVMFHTPQIPCAVKIEDSPRTWISLNQFDPNSGLSTVLLRPAKQPARPPKKPKAKAKKKKKAKRPG